MRYLVLLLLTGCALGQRESSVSLPNGQIYKVRCQTDGKMEYQDKDVKISVDNRGRQSIVESVLGAGILAWIKDE